MIDVLLYLIGAVLVLWLLGNLATYLYISWWMRSNLHNLKRLLEEETDE